MGTGVPFDYSEESIKNSWEWKRVEKDNSGIILSGALSFYSLKGLSGPSINGINWGYLIIGDKVDVE